MYNDRRLDWPEDSKRNISVMHDVMYMHEIVAGIYDCLRQNRQRAGKAIQNTIVVLQVLSLQLLCSIVTLQNVWVQHAQSRGCHEYDPGQGAPQIKP